MTTDTTRRAVLGGGLGLVLAGVAGCASAPEPDAAAELRVIDLGLWAGSPGARFGDPVEVVDGSRLIRGPFAWTHPVTGERLQVYERLNREPEGDKRQLFRLNSDGAALGRVFDSRPGQSDRVFVGDAFFPLGPWAPGERRSWRITEHQDGEARPRVATIRIRRLSYDYRGVPESLKYDWILTDPAGRKLFDERFIYSPGEGFVKFIDRMA